jgi:hypothetical protein
VLLRSRHRLVSVPWAVVEAGMATKITVAVEDDLDGGPAEETVRFGLDGADYEMDLSKKNAAALRKKLTPFVEHARRAGRGQRRREARSAASGERGSDIRAWAKDLGHRGQRPRARPGERGGAVRSRDQGTVTIGGSWSVRMKPSP